ncbi:MAG: RNA-binding cell elongation regulator Jag/EloR [Caldilineaceae bacterium]
MNESYEFQGKTVDDAIAEGLIKLGLSREQVEVEVIHKGSRGIFGLGSEPARVLLSQRLAQAGEGQPAAAPAESVVPPAQPAAPADGDEDDGQPPFAEALADDEPDQDFDEDVDDARTDEGVLDDISDAGLLELAQGLLQQMVALMGYDADVLATWQEPEPGEHERCLMLDVQGAGLGTLIGRRGETLSNIQFLLRLMINQKTHAWYNIVVDVAGYKQRRAEQLTQLALRIAEQVMESGRSASLEPMPSNERRIIHMALREHPDVYTQSSGEGDRRKVHIAPKQ